MENDSQDFANLRKSLGIDLSSTADLLEITFSDAERLESGVSQPSVQQIQALKGFRASFPSRTSFLTDKRDFLSSKTAESAPNIVELSDRRRKAELGQFFTPAPIANFMAGLFSKPRGHVFLLDAGAGNGSLIKAFVETWKSPKGDFSGDCFCFECDRAVLPELHRNLEELADQFGFRSHVMEGDFIKLASSMIVEGGGQRFTHAILNPPYKKIGSSSEHRLNLREAGLETVNLYAGFVGLAVSLMQPGGEIVAIVPRSFCNGPYYQPFREHLLKRSALGQIHLFEHRDKAFSQDRVLQENVIIRLAIGERQGNVKISRSSDGSFDDYAFYEAPFQTVVKPNDNEMFIHIPLDENVDISTESVFTHSLKSIGVECSTGPVVDFRLKDDLFSLPGLGMVPLLYPGHFSSGQLIWPKSTSKKPNAIRVSDQSKRWLMPRGFYTVVRRFSSKEESRRIFAAVVQPDKLPEDLIGFENHLNVFHLNKGPIDEWLAWGLAAYLNSMDVDKMFRKFSGHTQVNATDLRKLPYPSKEQLIALGRSTREQSKSSAPFAAQFELTAQ
jgi:adenine-specific DNA-methyltransferase